MHWPLQTATTTWCGHPYNRDKGRCSPLSVLGTSSLGELAHKLQPTCPDPSQVDIGQAQS